MCIINDFTILYVTTAEYVAAQKQARLVVVCCSLDYLNTSPQLGLYPSYFRVRLSPKNNTRLDIFLEDTSSGESK